MRSFYQINTLKEFNRLIAGMELVWIVFTVLLVAAILYPIYSSFTDYQFLTLNILYIAVFITLTRYVFLFRFVFWSRWQYVKIALIILAIPLLAYLINSLENFHKFMDEVDANAWMYRVPESDRAELMTYILNEMSLFGVGSIISAVLMPFRLLVSVWRQRNRGNV